MAVQLDHTIVRVRDKQESAGFVAEILGLPAPRRFGPFMVVELQNSVALEFLEVGDDFVSAHYSFLVSDGEFEEIFDRVTDRGLPYWSGPEHQGPGATNDWNGGRGVYFDDPNGHSLEIQTRPYGDG